MDDSKAVHRAEAKCRAALERGARDDWRPHVAEAHTQQDTPLQANSSKEGAARKQQRETQPSNNESCMASRAEAKCRSQYDVQVPFARAMTDVTGTPLDEGGRQYYC